MFYVERLVTVILSFHFVRCGNLFLFARYGVILSNSTKKPANWTGIETFNNSFNYIDKTKLEEDQEKLDKIWEMTDPQLEQSLILFSILILVHVLILWRIVRPAR